MTAAIFSEPALAATPEDAPCPRRINPWMMLLGAMVPNWLLCRPEISQGAKLCYARLAQFAGRDGQCFPKQDTVAGELGVSDRMVRDYVGELVEFRLIESEQHGLGTSNSYHFLDHPWIQEGQPDTGAASGPDRQLASVPDRKNSSGQERQSSSGPLDKRIREEIQDKGTHTHRTAGLPRSESEAVEVGKLHGVPEDFAREQFNRMEAVGWLDGTHRQVKSWPHYLKQRWSADQSQRAERRTTGRVARPVGPPRQFDAANYQQPVENF